MGAASAPDVAGFLFLGFGISVGVLFIFAGRGGGVLIVLKRCYSGMDCLEEEGFNGLSWGFKLGC